MDEYHDIVLVVLVVVKLCKISSVYIPRSVNPRCQYFIPDKSFKLCITFFNINREYNL